METVIATQGIIILIISGFTFWIRKYMNDVDMKFKEHSAEIKEIKNNSADKFERITEQINKSDRNLLEKLTEIQIQFVNEISKLREGLAKRHDTVN